MSDLSSKNSISDINAKLNVIKADNHHSNIEEKIHFHSISSNLKTALFLNLTFAALELVGGLFTNSMAIISDAIHDLGDSFAILFALIFEKISLKGRDKSFSYGYRRFSPLAALVNTSILIAGSIYIIAITTPKLWTQHEVKSEWMIILAIVGLVFNGLAAYKMSKTGHSANAKAVFLHLMEDVLGWAAVFVGSIVIYFTGWFILDPILAILIALFILYRAIVNFIPTAKIFLQYSPPNADWTGLINELKKIDTVINVHDFHSWTLDGEYLIVSLHFTVDDTISSDGIIKIKRQAKNIMTFYKVNHYTIGIDFKSENCEFGDC